MPFFSRKKKMSSEHSDAKAKLEYQLYLAESSPEPVIDLSSCDLSKIPSGILSLCKILNKEELCLQDNKLSDFSDQEIKDNLQYIKKLNLHSNKLLYLPSDIGFLSNLLVLNVANNKLKSLPSSFDNLSSLQVLDLSHNRFQEFPLILCRITSLQSLNLKENKIKSLPVTFCGLQNLHTLNLDFDRIIFPKKEIIDCGIEEIIKFLCSVSGKEYNPKNTCLNDSNRETSSSFQMPFDSDEKEVLDRLSHYKDMQEGQRLMNYEYEKEQLENEEREAFMLASNSAQNENLLKEIANQSDQLECEFLKLQSENEKSNKQLLEMLDSMERQCSATIEDIMKTSLVKQDEEALMEQVQKDNDEILNLLEIKQEEIEELQKKDVLNAMQGIVLADAELQKLIQSSDFQFTQNLHSFNNDDELSKILNNQEDNQKELVAELLQQEKYQKEAFESLFIKKDEMRNNIQDQISLVQTELASLSAVELKNRDENQKLVLEFLADKRETLAQMLEQLMINQAQREEEIRSQLKMLDENHSAEEENYWLIQYQRLMERKPKKVLRSISSLDDRIQRVLIDSNADEYIPIFACKHITFESFLDMNNRDLLNIGIVDENARAVIVKNIVLLKENTNPSAPCESVIEKEDDELSPNAPPLETPHSSMTVSKIWIEAECVICLDRKCEIIFLACGHVCCCQHCSLTIDICPMCRKDITNKLPVVAALS